jgi:DNA-binding NarL/FixJ family response regulator
VTALVEPAGATSPGRLVSPAARLGVLVVVADPVRRAAAIRSLAHLGVRDVTEAASVAEARARALSGSPRDLLVVDVSLPDGGGLALVAELRSAGWTRGLVLSAHDDPYTVRAALAAGVRAFVVATPQRSSGVSASVPTRGRAGLPGGPDGLSAREIEVLRLVAEGKTNRDIGDALGLSALTVKSHLARIARKLGTGDRAEMVVLALRAGAIA